MTETPVEKRQHWPDVDYSNLPVYMREGTELYVEHGIVTGSFLRAVLENNLVNAYANADMTNTARMRDWAQWLYSEAPAPCWGSHREVGEWVAHQGIAGWKEEEHGKKH